MSGFTPSQPSTSTKQLIVGNAKQRKIKLIFAVGVVQKMVFLEHLYI
jgi:hypothetical protein